MDFNSHALGRTSMSASLSVKDDAYEALGRWFLTRASGNAISGAFARVACEFVSGTSEESAFTALAPCTPFTARAGESQAALDTKRVLSIIDGLHNTPVKLDRVGEQLQVRILIYCSFTHLVSARDVSVGYREAKEMLFRYESLSEAAEITKLRAFAYELLMRTAKTGHNDPAATATVKADFCTAFPFSELVDDLCHYALRLTLRSQEPKRTTSAPAATNTNTNTNANANAVKRLQPTVEKSTFPITKRHRVVLSQGTQVTNRALHSHPIPTVSIGNTKPMQDVQNMHAIAAAVAASRMSKEIVLNTAQSQAQATKKSRPNIALGQQTPRRMLRAARPILAVTNGRDENTSGSHQLAKKGSTVGAGASVGDGIGTGASGVSTSSQPRSLSSPKLESKFTDSQVALNVQPQTAATYSTQSTQSSGIQSKVVGIVVSQPLVPTIDENAGMRVPLAQSKAPGPTPAPSPVRTEPGTEVTLVESEQMKKRKNLLFKKTEDVRSRWKHPMDVRQLATITLHQTHAIIALLGVSQLFVSGESSVNQSTLSLYLRARYMGNQETIESKLKNFVNSFICGKYDQKLPKHLRDELL